MWFVCIKHEQHATTKERCGGRCCADKEAERRPNGACLSCECQLGPLPGYQYSVLMQGCGFPQTDVTVPCQSPRLLVPLSGVDHASLYQHSGLCQCCWNCHHPRRDRSWDWQFCGSFRGKKVLTSGPLRQVVMSNTLIIPSSF